jgi:chromosome segregation ATPase
MAVSMLRKMHNELFEAEIWLIEADSELSILRERSSEVRTMLDNREREIRELAEQLRKQRDICKRHQAEFQKVREEMEDPAQDEILEEWGADESKTPDDLEAEIESTRQRIDLLHEGNPQAIHQYEKRAKEIERFTEKVANFEGDLQELNQKISSIRESWEPELDALVSEISDAFAHNFEMIGCAGQVGVYKDEDDFKDWSIRIQVKFRYVQSVTIPLSG